MGHWRSAEAAAEEAARPCQDGMRRCQCRPVHVSIVGGDPEVSNDVFP